MKKIKDLVADVYQLMDTKEVSEYVDQEAIINTFGENMKNILRQNLKEYRGGNNLRMSNIGKKDRQLWYLTKGYEGEPLTASTRIKFLYGYLIEEMLLSLVKLSGHKVTHEQARVSVEGISGSMDCKIDGVLVDVKSASTFSFKKFKDGSLIDNDPFGYVDQIKGYAEADGDTKFGWLVMDKTLGNLTVLQYDMNDNDSEHHEKLNNETIRERIVSVKEMIKQEEPPEKCYEPIPDGKSGNMKLPTGCSYCSYKKHCWKNMRTFIYSTGPRYLVEVVKEPKVIEVDNDGRVVSQEIKEFFTMEDNND